MFKKMKGMLLALLAASLVFALVGCSGNAANADEAEKVVILTNSDEEAVAAIENALKDAGYEGKYIIQSLSTSELGGKLIAEGEKINANLVTMSSYFVESAQEKHKMFTDLTFTNNALEKYASYHTPILANTGSIFVNTEVIKEKKLPMPTSIKDLTKPEFKGFVSIPNIMDSSTAWLLVQAVIAEYGEQEGKNILHDLIANTGPHLESSGSGPIKKVQAGEVATGFGLRHQAVIAKEQGAPIDYVDPTEGNFSLTETVAIVKKDDKTTELAMKMAEVIIQDGREELITHYPVPLYEGESVSDIYKPAHTMSFEKPLTVELLKQHQEFFNAAK
ncbi:extracellular solute-binding protein [Bacillus niameyensis]|uniref:extracellular solute-binding protein n=1 Tax=Bacillus niameyensis TaxID=1522308 RepID=UPI0007828210|nr:extracellular solute-binding protein [Bacillus niameyensis]